MSLVRIPVRLPRSRQHRPTDFIDILSRCTPVRGRPPREVAEAQALFESAYNRIRARVRAHRARYQHTKYADCPPTHKDEFRFFVGCQAIAAAQRKLLGRYGRCSFRWAYVVAWVAQEAGRPREPKPSRRTRGA